MNFGQAIVSCFSKYADFNGRSCRSEYWYWYLLCVLGGFATRLLDAALLPGNDLKPISTLFYLAIIVPLFAVGARRLHDIDKSGWWQLLWFVPIVGWIIIIIWAIKEGDAANNRFGADPLASLAA
jgi:uncharacterized membrane protein YhaH (DUF805 family)